MFWKTGPSFPCKQGGCGRRSAGDALRRGGASPAEPSRAKPSRAEPSGAEPSRAEPSPDSGLAHPETPVPRRTWHGSVNRTEKGTGSARAGVGGVHRAAGELPPKTSPRARLPLGLAPELGLAFSPDGTERTGPSRSAAAAAVCSRDPFPFPFPSPSPTPPVARPGPPPPQGRTGTGTSPSCPAPGRLLSPSRTGAVPGPGRGSLRAPAPGTDTPTPAQDRGPCPARAPPSGVAHDRGFAILLRVPSPRADFHRVPCPVLPSRPRSLLRSPASLGAPDPPGASASRTSRTPCPALSGRSALRVPVADPSPSPAPGPPGSPLCASGSPGHLTDALPAAAVSPALRSRVPQYPLLRVSVSLGVPRVSPPLPCISGYSRVLSASRSPCPRVSPRRSPCPGMAPAVPAPFAPCSRKSPPRVWVPVAVPSPAVPFRGDPSALSPGSRRCPRRALPRGDSPTHSLASRAVALCQGRS